MSYIDGFVAAVPTANREKYIRHASDAGVVFRDYGATEFVLAVPTANYEAYRKMAEDGAPVFLEHGAIHVLECWGDDVPEGEVTSFPMAVKCQPDETVVFSWIVWPDKVTRDRGMQQVMEDPRLQPDVNPMPFDGKRLIYGGFEVVVRN